MKTLLMISLMLFCLCPAKGQWNDDNEIAYKFYQDSTGFYLIKYEYNPNFCTIPLTLPPGEPHYPALITVYQVIENDTIQVGQPFDGTYVEKGCFEDVPEDQIKRAKSIVDIIETVPIKEFEVDSTYSWDYAFDADSILPDSPSITIPTLELMIEYQKECYNDSTEVGYSYTWNTTYYPDGPVSSYMGKDCYCVCSIYDENIKDWKQFDCEDCIYPEDFKAKQGFDYDTYKPILYRKEPTFEGFIEYMKHKYYK